MASQRKATLQVDGVPTEIIDENGFGVDASERVFFEVYINKQDISRDGTDYETGQPSEPAFQDMNFATTRKKYKGRFCY